MKLKFLALLLIPALLLSGCFLFKNEAQTILMEEQGLDISDATVKFFLNTRKNNADGITIIEAEFPDASFGDQLKNREGYRNLPLSQGLTDILYSIDLLKDQNGELLFPYADNGYYKVDLQFENEQFTLDRGADLIIAIFDADTKKFHYYHLGTDNMNLLKELQALIGNQ